MAIKQYNYDNPQATPASGGSGKIAPFQYELAPQKKTPAPVITKPTSVLKETIKALPSSIAENLPFGVGKIVKFANEDPESVYNLSFTDVLQGIVDTSKATFTGIVGAGANLYPKELQFNIPGLGQVTNRQFNAAERIRQGEDPTVVALDEGTGAIFDTLMLVGLMAEVASPRPVTIARGQVPEGITVKQPVKSFRLYNEPVATQTLSPEFVQKMAETKGVSLGKSYNPELPTYFKMTGKANGKVTGEVVQIRPSYVDTFINALKGNTSKVPEAKTISLISQTVNKNELAQIKPTRPATPPVETNLKVAPTPTEILKFDPNATTPKTPVKTPAIVDNAPTNLEGMKQANPELFKRAEKATTVDEFVESVLKIDNSTIDQVDVPTLEGFFNKVKTATEEPFDVQEELNISSELQAQAEEEWASTVAEDYAKISDQVSKLEKELKVAKKADRAELQAKIDSLNEKIGNIEEKFVTKWNDKAKKARAPKKAKPVKAKATEELSKDDKQRQANAQEGEDILKSNTLEEKTFTVKTDYGEVEATFKPFFAKPQVENYFAGVHFLELNGKSVSDTGFRSVQLDGNDVKDMKEVESAVNEIVKQNQAKETITKPTKKPAPKEEPAPKKEENGSTKPQKDEVTKPSKKEAYKPLTDLILKPSAKKDLRDVKTLVEKSDIKNLLANNKEFAKNPVLTVELTSDGDFLVYRGETSSFKIKASALGLDETNFKQNQKITIDKASLKEVGSEKQMRVYSGNGKSFASVDKFREDIAPAEKRIEDNVKPIEFPELIRLVRELTGEFPGIKNFPKALGMFYSADGAIKLNPSLFAVGNEQQAVKTLAHEIGHLIDYLPEKTLKRGNILGRLASLRDFRKSFFEDAGVSRTDQEMRRELWELSKNWKPLDEANVSPGYLSYRKSGKEIYADFISVLFNEPALAQQIAPESYNAFFKRLDEKPEVKAAYFDLQKLLAGTREEVLKARSADIKAGFEKAEDLQKEFDDKKKLAKGSSWERLRQQLDDVNYPILKRQRELEAKGQYLPDEQNPKYLLEEQSFADNENFLMMSDIDTAIDKPLEKAGLTREDFGEFLFLNRVVGKNNVPEETRSEDAVMGETQVGDGYSVTEMTSDELLNQTPKAPEATDRQGLANPFGFQIESAQEQLDFMKQSMGAEKFAVLEESAQKFHEIIFKSVEEAVNTGAYNKELFETKIKPNKDTYVTFAVVDYLQDRVPATVKAQHGTLKEIANPYISTILKTVALNRLNAYQRAKVATKELLQKTGEIEPSKAVTDGKLTIYKVAPGKGEFTLLEDGKLKSYDVDPYIAESFQKDKVGDLNTIVWLLDTFNNKLFKPLVTTYNLGFAAAFNPIRDFKRNYKNIPNATVFNLAKAYATSLPSAVRYTKGELDDFTKSLVESKAINAPTNDYQFDLSDDSEYQRILERFGLLPKKDGGILKGNSKAVNLTKVLLKPVTKTLEGMRFIANTLEIVSKIAGSKVRVAGGEEGKELAYNLRNYTGTPNFRRKGLQTKTTNAIFTFSNIMKEGMKTDFQMATNPNTRGGYWWKTVKIDILPKFLMFLAAAGYLGKELEEMFDKMSEYDKTNYITIPLGTRENGKVIYARIPHDETGRLISAMFWKMANFAKDNDAKSLQDVFAYGAGQLPQVNPAITILTNWTQYLSGRNPYDAFRGRTLIDDTTFTAGGGAALKKMSEWTVSELGLASFASYDTSKDTTAETFLRVTPWFNRVLKTTDYGLTEQYNKTVKEGKKEAAQVSLKKREAIQEYASKIDKPEDITQFMLVELEKEVYGKDSNDKARRTTLKNNLLTSLIRNDSPEVNSLLTATSNAQKIATLREIQKNMDASEFETLKLKLIKYKVVSADAMKTLNLWAK